MDNLPLGGVVVISHIVLLIVWAIIMCAVISVWLYRRIFGKNPLARCQVAIKTYDIYN